MDYTTEVTNKLPYHSISHLLKQYRLNSIFSYPTAELQCQSFRRCTYILILMIKEFRKHLQ